VGEGAPLRAGAMVSSVPDGYDFDFCSGEAVLKMTVRDGRIVLPSGMSYRYLVLPNEDRITLPLARKFKQLADAGARLVGGKRFVGTPGLTDYKRADAEVRQIAKDLWGAGKVASSKTIAEVFRADGLAPDFQGEDLRYIHRRIGDADAYFVANNKNEARDVDCTLRSEGRIPELWDPETGDIRELPEFSTRNGLVSIPLHFEPAQSWFVVFRKPGVPKAAGDGGNFPTCRTLKQIGGSWQVKFDPRWGGPKQPVEFETLTDWSKHADSRIHYYSGTACYRRTLELTEAQVSADGGRLVLELGQVNVVARVKLNGKVCGIAWKPPYRVDITGLAKPGKNELEIEVANLWINRMIGDEQLPVDCKWKDFETLVEWPEWFRRNLPRPSGRYTFTTCKHYKKNTPLVRSGMFGPVRLLRCQP